jgi:hypothetical protein
MKQQIKNLEFQTKFNGIVNNSPLISKDEYLLDTIYLKSWTV